MNLIVHLYTIVVKLLKALYGYVPSSLLWYRHCLKSSPESIGFEAYAKDECVLNPNRDGYQCTACVYVDDEFLSCAYSYLLDCEILDINISYKETAVRFGKSLVPYLGMLLDFSEPGVAIVSMVGDQHESDLLKKECAGEWSMVRRFHHRQIDYKVLILIHLCWIRQGKDQLHSRGAVKVLFSAKKVRPDPLPVVGWLLVTRVTAPTEQDWDNYCKFI